MQLKTTPRLALPFDHPALLTAVLFFFSSLLLKPEASKHLWKENKQWWKDSEAGVQI